MSFGFSFILICTLHLLTTKGQLYDSIYDIMGEEYYEDTHIQSRAMVSKRPFPINSLVPFTIHLEPIYFETNQVLHATIPWYSFPIKVEFEVAKNYGGLRRVWASILSSRTVAGGFVYEAVIFVPLRYKGRTQKCYLGVSTNGKLDFYGDVGNGPVMGCEDHNRDIIAERSSSNPTVFIYERVKHSHYAGTTLEVPEFPTHSLGTTLEIPKLPSHSFGTTLEIPGIHYTPPPPADHWKFCINYRCNSFVTYVEPSSSSYQFPSRLWVARFSPNEYYSVITYDEGLSSFVGMA